MLKLLARPLDGLMQLRRRCPRSQIFPDLTGYFYSFDCNERSHVHVRRERLACKFWLEPVALAANYGFSPRQLNQIRAIIEQEWGRIQEAWSERIAEISGPVSMTRFGWSA
jgi:Domain of unknown function (DUF4160)